MEGLYENDLKQKVREIAKNYRSINLDSPALYATTIKQVAEEYAKTIKDFFSSDGAGDQIKLLYQKVRPSFNAIPTVNIQDLNYTSHMYDEYINGMMSFLKNETSIIDGSNTDSEIEKLKSYMEKDKMYIESLFGNGSNVKTSENISLEDGLTNLEVFIDFIPTLTRFTDFANEYKEMLEEAGHSSDEIVGHLMKLYCDSVVTYSEYLIISLFACFQVLTDSVWKKPSFMVKPKKDIANFVLF